MFRLKAPDRKSLTIDEITCYFILSIVLLTSFSSVINLKNYLFIPVSSYILLASAGCFIMVILMRLITRKTFSVNLELNKADASVLLFYLYYVLRFGFSTQFRQLSDSFYIYTIYTAIYFYIKSVPTINTKKFIKSLIYIIIASGTLQCLYAFLQFIDIAPTIFEYKLGGSFMNNGDLANFLCIPYTLSLGVFLLEPNRKRKFILLIISVLHLAIIVISFARTAWISSILASCLLFYFLRFKNSNIEARLLSGKKKKYIIIGLIVLLSPLAILKLYSIKPDSANGRIFIWKQSVRLIIDKPLFGHGYESFIGKIRGYQANYFMENPDDIENGWIAGEPVFAFNDFLQIGVEYGLTGLAIFIIMLLYPPLNTDRKNDEREQRLLLCLKTSILAIIICMLFSYPLYNRSILLCLFILLAVISKSKKEYLYNVRFQGIKPLYIILILPLIYIGINSYNSIKYGIKWRDAFIGIKSNDKNYAVLYEEARKYLDNNSSFLLNYAGYLHHSTDFAGCINHLEKFALLIGTTDTYLMLADAYEQMKNYPMAEKYYIKAANIVPHKFTPVYRLFKLYDLTGQKNKAIEAAKKIRGMKIKVYSGTVKEIKNEVYNYLSDEKSVSK